MAGQRAGIGLRHGWLAVMAIGVLLALLLGIPGAGLVWAQGGAYDPTGINDLINVKKFMELRKALEHNIGKAERNRINFALGEYYFKLNSLYDAKVQFQNCLLDDAGSAVALIAATYLYKICKSSKSESVQSQAQDIKKDIFNDRFLLLFKKNKTLEYKSRFGNIYKMSLSADSYEIFLNGNIFERVTP